MWNGAHCGFRLGSLWPFIESPGCGKKSLASNPNAKRLDSLWIVVFFTSTAFLNHGPLLVETY
jgi:hypothetical protein